MGKDTLKAAVVGTGIFATDQHLPTFQKIPYIEPVSCYNRTKSKAETFANKAGIDPSKVYESLENAFEDNDVDFVDVLLPVQYNLDVVKLAIEHNKPLALEKPIAANLTQASEIVKLSESTKLPIAILENWGFMKTISLLKKEYLPQIGDVTAFSYKSTGPWNTNNKYLSTTWRQNPEHIGGFLSDGGVHQLTLLTEVLGPVKTVSGLTKQLKQESGADDILFSTMSLESGAIGTFTYGSAFGATEKKLEFVIFGTNGSITFVSKPSLNKPTITFQTGDSNATASEPVTIEVDEVDNYEQEFINFADAVYANDKSLITIPPAKAFHHLAIVAAALESSEKNGSSVTVASP